MVYPQPTKTTDVQSGSPSFSLCVEPYKGCASQALGTALPVAGFIETQTYINFGLVYTKAFGLDV